MTRKRAVAYILDLFLVTFIATMLFTFIPAYKDDYEDYNKYSEELGNKTIAMLNGKENITDDEIIDIEYNVYKSSEPLLIFKIGITILYFGVLAYIQDGQTLFKKILKIKVKSSDDKQLRPHLFMLRSIILTNIIPETITLILLMVASKSTWYSTAGILSQIENITMFILLLSCIISKDGRGLHDKLCKTEVVPVVKEKKV